MSFGQVALQFLLPLSERKHAVQALAVLGLAYAAAFPIQGAIVYHLRGNEVFPVPVAVHFPVLAQLGQELSATEPLAWRDNFALVLRESSAALSLLLLLAECMRAVLVLAA